MNNAFKPYLFIILSCSLAQFIIFFLFFLFLFCHYFMYPNNYLNQKLAVSEILNNVSLFFFFGDPIAASCVLFFFLAGCIMCTNGWRKKNFLQNRNFFLIFNFFIFYNLLHYLLEVKTIFFTQLFKRFPLSAANNNWFNHQRCHIVKFYLEFCLMMILSPM